MDAPLILNIKKSQAFLGKTKAKKRSEVEVFGKYFLRFDLTAGEEILYIPVSIATGRKSTGFIYLVEGTAESNPTASITWRGKETAIVTSGSISYCKIPTGKTATFEIRAHVHGTRGKKYKFVLSRINYKLNPNDLRYKRFLTEVSTDSLKFR